jgi:hypothetical protein
LPLGDVAAIRTRAVYDEAGGEWVLNGVKSWRLTAASPTCTRRVRELASSGWIAARWRKQPSGPIRHAFRLNMAARELDHGLEAGKYDLTAIERHLFGC